MNYDGCCLEQKCDLENVLVLMIDVIPVKYDEESALYIYCSVLYFKVLSRDFGFAASLHPAHWGFHLCTQGSYVFILISMKV